MLSRNSLIDDVRRRAVDTGYQLTETDDGFRLERDISDMTWWGPAAKGGVTFLVAHRVRLDEAHGRMTILAESRNISWRGGAIPQPSWSGRATLMRGRIHATGFRKTYGGREDGSFGVLRLSPDWPSAAWPWAGSWCC
jgi:hypothetical protein